MQIKAICQISDCRKPIIARSTGSQFSCSTVAHSYHEVQPLIIHEFAHQLKRFVQSDPIHIQDQVIKRGIVIICLA